MNEGENTGMPKSPDFSSPNTPPQTPPQASAQSANPAVFAAAANLPDNDPSQPAQAITSAGAPMSAGQRSRFGFGRKFKDQQPQQPTTAFTRANAPEYFNQAVGDIVIKDEAAAAQKKKTKKILLIAVAALVVLGGALAGVLLLNQASKPSAGKVRTAFNRYANYILYGEEKDSDIGEYSATTRYTIMDKYINVDENYNKRFKELFDNFYKEYNAAAEQGMYEKGGLDNYATTVYGTYLSFTIENNLDIDEIDEQYEASGKDVLLSAVETEANKYSLIEDSRFLETWKDIRTNYIEYLDYKKSYSCYIENNEKAYEGCSAPTDEEKSEASAAVNRYIANQKQYEIYKEDLRKSIISDLFSVLGEIDEK